MKRSINISAYYVQQQDENITGKTTTLPFSVLPDNEVTIKVQYSSLNYKDALSARGLNHVTRSYPHIPGIDAAGIVVEDLSDTFTPDSKVIVTGNDLGTNCFGGFGDHIRVPANWVVALPDPLTLEQSMIVGTAGFTALYGIHRLHQVGFNTRELPALVTGATGGVGSFAVFALSELGFRVVASSRDNANADFLAALGAEDFLSSDEILDTPNKPLLPRKFAAAIETVGGDLLDAVLRQLQPKGAVACCGNILGMDLNTSILPFILRGISLLGIDSALCVREIREKIWTLAATFDFSRLPDGYHKIISLDELDGEIERILEGKQTGRVVLQHHT